MLKRLGSGILLALLAMSLIATPVYADTANPDTPPGPTIDNLNIYRNLLETGDMLIIVYANIPYAVPPDTPVTQTFIWRLIDEDGVTELGSTVGYAYNDDGYGYNVYSLYFTKAEFDALGMVYGGGETYTMRLSGNPAVFDTPPVYNFTINAGNYSALTDRADVQAELAARILTIAADLDNKWGLALSLLTQNETATVLSAKGEAFFRGAIHGLQAMAPTVFSVVIRVIDIDPRVWDPEYSENVTGQWTGTWAETAQEAGKALFGTTYDLLSIIMLLAMSVGLLICNIQLTGDHWNGMIDVTVLMVIGARLAMYDLAFLMLIAALCWIYIGMKVWFGLIK